MNVMPMNIYFAGHNSFGNRGCEALVRSITGLVRQELPDATFSVPATRADLDARQWPQHAGAGVQLVQAPSFPTVLRWWHWSRRLLPAVEHLGRPTPRLPEAHRSVMAKADVVVMTGGDTISLDYDLPSLYDHASYIDNARKLGKKTVLWAASVGPFARLPHVEAIMRKHLASYDQITVRESATLAYLRGLGLDHVVQVTDPAFTLKPEPFDAERLLPAAPNGVIGLNVSPLIRKFRESEASREALDAEVAQFIKKLHTELGYAVLLIPHVGPLDGGTRNSDHVYMAGLVERFHLQAERVVLAPDNLNAAQLKFLLSRLRFFIGARTHATIGAFSMGVPTLSIAYSIKAKGINRDLFGDLPVVLDTPKVTCDTLVAGLDSLVRHEAEIQQLLADRLPLWRQRAAEPAAMLKRLLPAG
jgi:polysaccharide pyruvyl transferase WcaK-like protein